MGASRPPESGIELISPEITPANDSGTYAAPAHGFPHGLQNLRDDGAGWVRLK